MDGRRAHTGIDLRLDGIDAEIRQRHLFTLTKNGPVFDQPFPAFRGLMPLWGF
jgi:hypothetical protein